MYWVTGLGGGGGGVGDGGSLISAVYSFMWNWSIRRWKEIALNRFISVSLDSFSWQVKIVRIKSCWCFMHWWNYFWNHKRTMSKTGKTRNRSPGTQNKHFMRNQSIIFSRLWSQFIFSLPFFVNVLNSGDSLKDCLQSDFSSFHSMWLGVIPYNFCTLRNNMLQVLVKLGAACCKFL